MKLKNLSFTNLRNYQTLDLPLHNNTTIFIGNNAQGKTSILEAIYILAFTKSHRTIKDSDVIKHEEDFAKISALIHLNDRDIQLDIILSKLGKKAKYNQIELERLSEYIGLLNVVMFAPEDLELIKGNPKDRRKFLDIEIGQISKEYVYDLQQYKKILKQRNDLLKTMQKSSERNELLLDVITDQLIDYQVEIMKLRTEFLATVERYSTKHYKRLSSSEDTLSITYIPSLKGNIKEEYISKYQYDIITGTTNNGIHRDEVEFYLNDHPLKSHGSQGEQRTAVLAVKLALIDFIYQYKKEYPVLLLDDVMSELDIVRQNNLLDYINNDIQTFITTTDIHDIDIKHIQQYDIYEITDGTVKECDKHGKE
jgi:DNA replication and repair protein RecF